MQPEISATPQVHLRFGDLALAAIANALHPETAPAAEIEYLRQRQRTVAQQGDWQVRLQEALRRPADSDQPLLDVSAGLGLSPLEILTVALAIAVEQDAVVGRALVRIQTPAGGSRPTLGLVVAAFARLLSADASPWDLLLNGAALRSGLLVLHNDAAPLPERAIAVPVPLCLALSGATGHWPGATESSTTVPLPPSTLNDARRQAHALANSAEPTLHIRCGSPSEGRAVATLLARQLERTAVFVEGDRLAGFGPWLRLRKRLPVFVYDLAPSEHRLLPELPGYDGPVLVLSGPDGAVAGPGGSLPEWSLAVPPAAERAELWQQALGPGATELTRQLAAHHRHSAGRIAQIGRLARHHARLINPKSDDVPPPVGPSAIVAAAWSGEAGGLDSLAEPLRAPIPDEALVAPPALRASLELLLLRCRSRDGLVDGLGVSATARYRPGVRALFTGPSGTGKTLAAGWLATHLGLPLYRVDLAGVSSKYIGETEKNLARLLARAEQTEVVLLFDEADSLFGKRTDIRDSNDRFANAQTNYLLQRIENYDGLVLLTSNSKARFDSAFARRLDVVLDFPLPNPDERRALWLAHLGPHHALAPAELNRLAAIADLAGGHIRNAVLTAALLARHDGRPIVAADCLRGLEEEYRKVGHPYPDSLRTGN